MISLRGLCGAEFSRTESYNPRSFVGNTRTGIGRKAGGVRRIGFRHQRTIAAPAVVRGVGIVTGTPVTLRFLPAPVDTGLVFARTDLQYRPTTPATADRVTGTNRRTTLGDARTGVTLVEHVLSALAGLRIDNCIIELDAVEPPGLDGSSLGYVQALNRVGGTLQSSRRPIYAATTPIAVEQNGATITLHPPEASAPTVFRAGYILDYGPQSAIPRQVFTLNVTPGNYVREVASCRTFLLDSEADQLRKQGIGKHLKPSEVLVFGPRGPIDNTLRHADEPARHKVLDIIGDLALCGFDIAGHVTAYRSGHALNAALALELMDRVGRRGEAVLPARVPLPRSRRAA